MINEFELGWNRNQLELFWGIQWEMFDSNWIPTREAIWYILDSKSKLWKLLNNSLYRNYHFFWWLKIVGSEDWSKCFEIIHSSSYQSFEVKINQGKNKPKLNFFLVWFWIKESNPNMVSTITVMNDWIKYVINLRSYQYNWNDNQPNTISWDDSSVFKVEISWVEINTIVTLNNGDNKSWKERIVNTNILTAILKALHTKLNF